MYANIWGFIWYLSYTMVNTRKSWCLIREQITLMNRFFNKSERFPSVAHSRTKWCPPPSLFSSLNQWIVTESLIEPRVIFHLCSIWNEPLLWSVATLVYWRLNWWVYLCIYMTVCKYRLPSYSQQKFCCINDWYL